MDAWIVAVVVIMAKTGKPVAALFVAEGAIEEEVRSRVLATVMGHAEHVEMSSLPPEVADAFKLKPGEVRDLR